MAKGKLFDLLKNAVDNVQQNNRENASQQTAPGELFRRLQDQLGNMQELNQERKAERLERRGERREERQERRSAKRELKDQFKEQKGELKNTWQEEETANQNPIDAVRRKIEELKRDNEAREDEPTADSGMWDDLMKEVQVLESIPATKVEYNEPPKQEHNPFASSGAAPIGNGVIVAQGSVSVKAEPNMGSQKSNFRIPEGAVVNLLAQDNANPINLDGNPCGWCKVHYNGQEGWVLDAYIGSV